MSDPRLALVLPSLAAASLQGMVAAPRFRQTARLQCVVPVADLRRAPDLASEQDDQVLIGELFDVLGETDGFVFGQSVRDGYVGYLPAAALGPTGPFATHRISALRAYAFAEPDFKSAAVGPFALNSLISIEQKQGRYRRAVGGYWFVDTHLAPIGTVETDPAAIAVRFLGTPYRWGGRDGLGIDCSGLVQQSLLACGRGCPRNADQQLTLGLAVERAQLRRADLVFWPGHVGMMIDATQLIHANSSDMACVIEPLVQAEARQDRPPIGFRRVV